MRAFNKSPVPLLCLSAALAVLTGVQSSGADPITDPIRVFSCMQAIPDLSDPPVTFVQNIVDSPILLLSGVEVGLRLVGVTEGAGFASEMVVSLTRNLTDTSLLLNGAGITGLNPYGASYDGWDVSFRDDAEAGDVHRATLMDGVLGGSWQPDGRLSADGDARPALLSVFIGGTANGEWRLNVADLEFGGRMRLESWSLTFTGFGTVPPPDPDSGSGSGGGPGPVVVPEVSTGSIGALVLGGVAVAATARRRRCSTARSTGGG